MSEITLPVTLSNQTLSVARSSVALPRLQLGDQFQATVLSVRGNQVELQLPQGRVSATTDLPLRSGEQLKLNVTQLQPQVTLSIHKNSPPPAEALGQKIYPKQLPLAQALQSLGELMQSQSGGKGTQVVLQQLLQQLPTLAQLFSPKEIKEQIGKSGTFLENNLLQQRPGALKGDLKMQLLQMRNRLLQQPEQQKALRLVESMIARIELNQLKSAQNQSQGGTTSQPVEQGGREPAARSWQVEVPFMLEERPQQIGLKFRQQSSTEEEDQARWHLEIQLDPPGLGEIEVHAIHHHEQLDIHFLTAEENTSALISNHLPQLEASLSVAGIETGTLFSRQKSIHDAPPPAPLSTGFSIKV